jgi:pyruvate-formate lyase-activating enzyme
VTDLPIALYADERGEIYDAPGYAAVGRVGTEDAALMLEDMIEVPDGTDLMFLPGCSAVASLKGKTDIIATPLLAVAAVLPVGYTRTHLPAYRKQPGTPLLPLYGYAAVAFHKDKIYVAAVKSDDNAQWHPHRFNTPDLARKIDEVRNELPGNRLVEHLARCSEEWHCCTAQNLFYRRWEAGIPVSPACNANCLGCISLQPAECCPAPQSRIEFAPGVDEVAQLGVYHLTGAPEPIISFGQGCEGEPSLAAETIAAAMRQIRGRIARGIININTNAGYTEGIKIIADAGLNSMRVSVISARPETHQAYYRGDYTLDNVRASIAYAKTKGVYVSLNMLLLPGLNDRSEEVAAWLDFIRATGVDMIQLRNLNIDPDMVWAVAPIQGEKPLGVRAFIDSLRREFPEVKIGNFSRYIGE